MLGVAGRALASGLVGLGIIVSTASCGDGDPLVTSAPEDARDPSTTSGSLPAVPWSAVTDVVNARRGEYREVLTVSAAGQSLAMMEEWFVYDLDASLVDRRIALHYDPETGDLLDSATRENPSLRFVYTSSGAFMWHPRAEATCGTPWVTWRPEDLEDATGLAVDPGQLIVVAPVEALRAVTPPESPVTNDEDATVYEVTVPGGTGIGLGSALSNPELAEQITSEPQSATVRLPRDGGPIEVTIDLTEALQAATPQGADGDGRATLVWTVTAPLDAVDIAVPTDAADRATCE